MNQKMKTLQIIHLALCAGLAFAYYFTGGITLDKLKIKDIKSEDYIYLAIPIVAVILSQVMFKSQLKSNNSKTKTEDNYAMYQTASLIRWAIIEGAAFVILFVKPEFIVLGLVLILYLLFLRPTENQMANDLQSI